MYSFFNVTFSFWIFKWDKRVTAPLNVQFNLWSLYWASGTLSVLSAVYFTLTLTDDVNIILIYFLDAF